MAKVEVVMPQMGESVMEGTVIEWTKKVGDTVEVDETLLEIATDKVDTEVPSPESGVLVEILVKADETVEVGQAIAIIETDAEAAEPVSGNGESSKAEKSEETDAKTKREDEKEEETAAEEKVEAEKKEIHKSDDGEGERIEIVMPQMGESVMEGEVIEWLKKVGDKVEVDEPLLEIATDKVDTEVPSPEAGTLVEILVEAGETVEVGQPIAIVATGKEGAKKSESESEKKETRKTEKASVNGEPAEKEPAPVVEGGSEPQREGSDGRFYSPLVRSIAKKEGISQEELESIDGSGQGGRVAKQDILAYVENKKSGKAKAPEITKSEGLTKPETRQKTEEADRDKSKISAGELSVSRPSENVEIIKMDRMRKMIAEHMVKSKQTSAHVTTFSDVDVSNVVQWRNANKQKFYDQNGVKLTFTPIFIEAFISAMREFPLINSSVDGDEIIVKRDINFGIAVALGEGGKGGLIVPVIKNAHELNLSGLAREVHLLAEKARNKDLKPDDLVGGTITLTNYGSVGNLMGTPIINQPQVAIFGTGVIEKRPVVLETEQGDLIGIRHKMYLTMSYDHRIIDGAHGGAFLNRVKELLEKFDVKRAI
ncbi:MAG: 2-oxoglutarate dehydrogenase, E2 component, dihydrolipoamide succinyltransferase [Balneolaceae bacterium]